MDDTTTRRALIAGAGAVSAGAIVVPFAVTFNSSLNTVTAAAPVTPGVQLGAYLMIDASNTVTLSIGSTEMGQGIMTGMAQLVAEELQVNWTQMRVQHAPASAANPNPYANPLFHLQITGGSTSTRGWYLPMRQAAAIARQWLLNGAQAQYPGAAWSIAQGGQMTNGAKTVKFSDVVAKAATLPAPTSAPLATTSTFIGKRQPRTDIPAKVDGSAIYGIDVQVPGMVYAAVVHCPTQGGTVAALPSSNGGALALVNLGNAVGVVAGDTWSAMTLASSLASKIKWNLPANLALYDSAAIAAAGQALAVSTSAAPRIYETTGGVDAGAAVAASKTRIDATYTLPYLAHACMEVLNCTASVTANSCEVWAPTQGQQLAIYALQAITGLPASAINVHTTYLGGGLGRKFETDFVIQAVTISKAIGKPVKLTWSRTQDFQNDRYRPCAAIRVQAGASSKAQIDGFLYRNVSPSINIQRNTNPGNNPEDTGAVAGALGMPYNLVNRRIEFVPNPAAVPVGYWRSVGESYNTFAVESAIDELALALGVDPMQYRKTLAAGDARALAVLQALDKLSGWSTSKPPAGTGRGVAFLKGFGSYVAAVAQVSNSAGKVKVNKVFCAIDCGVAINPLSIENQMISGVVHGLAATLWGEVKFANGVANVQNFSNYRMMRLQEAPQVSVAIIPSAAAPGGVGEVGVPCVAPAVANAWAALTGARVRSLPFYPGSTMSDG